VSDTNANTMCYDKIGGTAACCEHFSSDLGYRTAVTHMAFSDALELCLESQLGGRPSRAIAVCLATIACAAFNAVHTSAAARLQHMLRRQIGNVAHHTILLSKICCEAQCKLCASNWVPA
jgi:hypothetical protein